MKKSLLSIFTILSILSLSACATNESSSSTSSGSQSSSSSDTSSSTSTSDTTPSGPRIRAIELSDDTSYHIGEIYNPNNVKVHATFTDNTELDLEEFTIGVSSNRMIDPTGAYFTATTAFNRPGLYTFSLAVRYKGQSISKATSVNVISGFDTEGYEIESIECVDTFAYSVGQVVANEIDNVELLVHWNHGEEYYTYTKVSDARGFTFSLKKQGDSITDYSSIPLEQNSTYNLAFTINGSSFIASSFNVYGNYYKLNNDDLTFLAPDIPGNGSSAKGNVKILIIPITLSGEYVDNWPSGMLPYIENYYFSSQENKVSVKSYYETASFGQLSISGEMAPMYTETDPDLKDTDIQTDSLNDKLKTLLSNAIEYVRANSDINLDEYDVDDDGYIDNPHFITNFDSNLYQDKTGFDAWATPLWPHKSNTSAGAGTKSSPNVGTYSLSALNFSSDAITVIHEQGHVFGLDDYYDYNYQVDYVGGADMQSNNIFDWNSFSKLSVGWVSPYVVTGPTELTIKAASLNGDCVIVPADPATFNNSAYDEYFLIELFSPYGNNSMNYPVNGEYQGSAWDYWESWQHVDLGDYGVRLYHVDARMQYWNSSTHTYIEATAEDKDKWLQCPFSNDYYAGGEEDPEAARFADFKLLSIIQQGGVNTLGDPSVRKHVLTSDDLFHEGDVFTFNRYKHFLSKSGQTVTTMDNGESFPYKITFKSMSASSATIKIELL